MGQKVKVEMDEGMAKFLSSLNNEDIAKFTAYKDVASKTSKCSDKCIGEGSSIYGMFYQLMCPVTEFYRGYQAGMDEYNSKRATPGETHNGGPTGGQVPENRGAGAKKPALEDYLSGMGKANGMPGSVIINTGCIQNHDGTVTITNPVYNGNGMGNACNGKGMNYTVGQEFDEAKMKAYIAEMLNAMIISKKAAEKAKGTDVKVPGSEPYVAPNVYEWMYEDGPTPIFQKKYQGLKGINRYMQNRAPLKMSNKLITIYENDDISEMEPKIETLDIYNDGFSDAYKTELLILPEFDWDGKKKLSDKKYIVDMDEFFIDADYNDYFDINEFNWYGNVTY